MPLLSADPARVAAAARGDLKYLSARPCPLKHGDGKLVERYTIGGACSECARTYVARTKAALPIKRDK
jgi:hypothetical protein